MSDISLPVQTAIEYRELFTNLGISRASREDENKLHSALVNANLEPVDRNKEVIILHERLQPIPDTSGCLGFLFRLFYEQRETKFHAVIIYSENDMYSITQGVIFITNSRLIVLSEEDNNPTTKCFDLSTLSKVDYELLNNVPVLEIGLRDTDILLIISYPKPSLATELNTIGTPSTNEERYRQYRSEQRQNQLLGQASNVKELLYDLFVEMLD